MPGIKLLGITAPCEFRLMMLLNSENDWFVLDRHKVLGLHWTSWRKKEIAVFPAVITSAYEDQLNVGFTKGCELQTFPTGFDVTLVSILQQKELYC